jgi:hypothetical protein
MTAACVAKALNGHRYGSGWMARCPAHRDNNPSLSLRDANGKILVHCFAGCSQDDVVAALRERGLWPERVKRDLTRGERRDYARKRARARFLAEDALLWNESELLELEAEKSQAFSRYECDPSVENEGVLECAARTLYVAEQLSPKNLAEAYLVAVKTDPARVRRLISKSKENLEDAKLCTKNLVTVTAARESR